MSDDGFDMREIDAFNRRLLNLANNQFPKETKKFLQKEGNKLKTKTRAKVKQKVKKDTGNYQKSIKRGKVYKFDGADSVRVYSGDPKSHLIEYGHKIVGKDGTEHGFKQGEHVFADAAQEFNNEFIADCEQFIDEMLDKGLR
ncbi:HK97 gp10 family phage protein [Cohnella sp. WQ 127256]|uniref:HK97 gp10 family phage protein n=1 Tax=Cohnella sp. WQ 127256 TaxID=2938790 RepID=UPI0021175A63|nr:HK97 gp10 family phage protein [Cohnella sp. WQ 127256]